MHNLKQWLKTFVSNKLFVSYVSISLTRNITRFDPPAELMQSNDRLVDVPDYFITFLFYCADNLPTCVVVKLRLIKLQTQVPAQTKLNLKSSSVELNGIE